jgi:PAS domain S-box-containing protein
MAPSAALLFVAHGVALCLRRWAIPGGREAVAGRAIGVGTGLIALALLALSSLGIRSPIEHVGMAIDGALHGAPLGHVSPVTAGCFLLASLATVMSPPIGSGSAVQRLLAFALAGVLLGTSFVFLQAYLYGRPLLYGGGLVPPAVNSTLAFFVLAVGLLVATRRQGVVLEGLHERARSSGWLLLFFILLAAGIVAAGHSYYQGHERRYRAEVERQLAAIADLKVAELTQWREERLSDARIFLGNESFSDLVQRSVEFPADTEPRARLTAWLRQVKDAHGHDGILVLSPHGAEVASAPAAQEPFAPNLRTAISECLRKREITFIGFHRDSPDHPILLSLLVPIYAPRDVSRSLGVLMLRVDPNVSLYPLIKRWPTASRTAETLIVRREGDDVLFLNELRFRESAALSLREPISNERLPAVQAVLGGTGGFEGVDYRGVDVISQLRSVPGSPWFLVARMDVDEVYGPLRERMWQQALLVALLLLATGAALGLEWRQQVIRFRLYRERLKSAEALRASEARYRALVENAPVAVFINRQSRVVEANLACLRLFGAQSKDQLLGRSPLDLFDPQRHSAIREQFQTLRDSGDAVPFLEETIVRLDGTTTEVEVTAAPFLDHGVGAIHVVLSDITERKAAERALLASENELRQRNDELTRFTYTVSHDLKSPLVTIQTFLGYLEKDLAKQDSAAVEKDFGFIRPAAQKMSRLLGELLELSRVGTTRNPSERVSLGEVVNEALALVAGRISERGPRVEVTQQQTMLNGDKVRLVEVFQNLVDNAVKFMGDEPSPLVEIGAEDSGGETVLFVRDNGSGIDPRHAGKLFGLFEKLDPNSEGTGVGLALVRRIVEVHGGRIWVESTGQGQGSCFRFTLGGGTTVLGTDEP